MFRIKDLDSFKKAFEQIALFIDECNIHVNDNGLTINAFDSAQMLYLEYNLSAQGITGELDSSIFGINIVEFNKIVSKLSANDSLSLNIMPYDLQLIIDGEYKRSYTFPLKELDEKELQVNVLEYPVLIAEKSKILKDIFTSAKLVGDAVLFDVNKEDVTLSAEGFYGKYTTLIKAKNTSKFQTKFSSSHLTNMLKNADINNNIEIRISPQQPLYVSYSIGNNTLKYFLAHMFV